MLDKDIANFIYEKTTRSTLDLDLRGIWINDRELLLRQFGVRLTFGLNTAVIGWDVVQEEIPAVDFVHKYEHVFAFKSVIL
jgi:carboxypeptidase D